MRGPLYKGGIFLRSRRYGKESDGRDDAGIAEGGSGGNHRVSDIVINGLLESWLSVEIFEAGQG